METRVVRQDLAGTENVAKTFLSNKPAGGSVADILLVGLD